MTQTKKTQTQELKTILCELICNYSADVPISAELIASEAYPLLDPNKQSPVLVQWACILELRQLSRSILRSEYVDTDESIDSQGELFTQLQDRYPGFGDNAGQYMPRKLMTVEDYDGNIARLRCEAEAKLAHADRLEAERLEKFGAVSAAA